MNAPETQQTYIPDRSLDLEEMTVNHYSIEGREANVLTLKRKRILDETPIERIGRETHSFLTEGDPNFNPNADYCIDFQNVQFASSALWAKMMTMDKYHQQHRKKNLSICSIIPDIYEFLKVAKLNEKFYADYEDQTEFLDTLK